MKFIKTSLVIAAAAGMLLSFSSCKSKKQLTKPTPPPVVAPEKPVEPTKEEKTASTADNSQSASSLPERPNFNFRNIQFEFNSAVLKTSSYEVLDQIAREMKKTSSAKFEIAGHSSAEGTAEHNQSLSIDRANAVKTYLVNAGISANNLSTIGYGESKPVTENKTEEGRALNRRVEIKKVN